MFEYSCLVIPTDHRKSRKEELCPRDYSRHFVRKRGRERRDGGEDFSVLRGVALTCGVCRNAVSDITLLPCGHKTVCRGCSGHVVQCPVCHYRVDRTTDDGEHCNLSSAL